MEPACLLHQFDTWLLEVLHDIADYCKMGRIHTQLD